MLGHRISKLRQDKGLTQAELAKALQITRSALSLYELNKREPDTVILGKIANYFGVSVDFLICRTDTPTDKITNHLSDDPELAEFWEILKEREDLQLFFKQTKNLSPADIKKVMRIIKAIEDEEAADDSL